MDKVDIKDQPSSHSHSRTYLSPKNMLDINKVDVAYSSDPWWYDLRGFLILTFAYRSTLPAQIRFFAKNIGPQHLEVAIGTGTLFELILKWRRWKKLPLADIIGFDYAERMLHGAQKRFLKEKKITLLRADASHLMFKDNSFDTVNIANSFHCLPEVDSSIHEIYRVLKKGGTFAGNCLLEPKGHGLFDRLSCRINHWAIKKGILFRAYDSEEVVNILLKSKFEIKSLEITGNCLNFVAQKSVGGLE